MHHLSGEEFFNVTNVGNDADGIHHVLEINDVERRRVFGSQPLKNNLAFGFWRRDQREDLGTAPILSVFHILGVGDLPNLFEEGFEVSLLEGEGEDHQFRIKRAVLQDPVLGSTASVVEDGSIFLDRRRERQNGGESEKEENPHTQGTHVDEQGS